ncbi:hypothetical protein [Streptomyces niveus]|uniref:hypothetical protein n=1 Tax=Streptomyces niveus TaxID=193462 RepID=UPI00366442CC
MKIVAENVVGYVFVVAVDEASALEAFDRDDTYTRERDAVSHETYRNGYDRHESGDTLNTYRIEVRAEKVH